MIEIQFDAPPKSKPEDKKLAIQYPSFTDEMVFRQIHNKDPNTAGLPEARKKLGDS